MRNKYKGQDIRARLGGTILRYKGIPYYCEAEGEIIALHDIVDKRLIARVSPDDQQLDISSLTLGYFNIKDKAVHAARQPHRRYKQGVDIYSLQYKVAGAERTRFEADQMFCKGFVDGIMGHYPTLLGGIEALTKLKTHTSIAISQDVAIALGKSALMIFIKGDEAGWIVGGTEKTAVPVAVIPKSETSWVTKLILEQASRQWTVSEGVPE